ncbi:MAG: hypothetical protein J2P36_16515, partial [Ktedonobacteraceae bacterium]|nr:hypothetical protein [Ktedonobacteraceae bacterium]
FDPAQVQGTPVFSPQVSYMMTSILTDEHARQREFAGDHDLSFWDWDTTCRVGRAPYPDCLQHQVAAKTGTTDNFRDNWTIGYTPNVVVGVWAGNANGQPMLNIAGISGAAPIWHSVMEFVSGRPCAEIDALIKCPNSFDRRSFHFSRPDTFTQPPGLQRVCTSNKDGLSGSGNCDWVIAGQAPQQSGLSSSPPPDDSDNPDGDVPPDQNNDSNNNNNNNANNNNSNNNMNNASPNDG